MKIIAQHRALVAFAVAGMAVAAAQAQTAAPEASWRWHPAKAVGEAVPPLPPPSTYPVQLLLDDDTSDGAFGLGGQSARQFLWFNRFSPAAGFHLDEVWVLFPSGANMTAGEAIQIAIYEDPDGNPANGANLLTSFAGTIQAADDNTFSIYPVAGSPVIPTGSDLLVGVVPRFIASGVTSPTLPAALDTTATQGRSWVAAWTTDPPDPPVLVPLPDQTLSLVDSFVPGGGNFMIRAFGTEQAVTEIPTLGASGLAVLALALFAAGAFLLRRRGAAATLALLSLTMAAPAGAVTIDTFTTNQATLTDPPGGNSVATGGADIIGTRRGIWVKNLAGAGPTSANVAAGALSLSITATTPDSRGEARLSWDGDTNALVLTPTGLAGVNLTAGNASGFQLDFASTTVVTEIEITVYDDAANFSRAARRVPVSGGAQSVRIPFAEFRVAGGTGADFASVGAIEMTVRGGEGTITLDQVTTTAPTVGATKVDTQIVDTDGDTRVDPGDRVRYTVTVTNSGNEALSVDLSDTVDANTTLVAGSVSSTPVAHNDQYGWFGNVTFATDGSAAKPNLLANDQDADGDTLTVQSGTFPATSAQGGTLTLVSAATGAFSYSPPAGFAGVDSFNYTVVDDNGNTSTATANIALQGVVWFVDDTGGGGPGTGAGTQTNPFITHLPTNVAGVGGVGDQDSPGDILFFYAGAHAGTLPLEADQQLIGEGEGLILDGQTIVAAGTDPTWSTTSGHAIQLSTNNTIRGLTFGNTAAGSSDIFGNGFGLLTVSNVVLNGNGQALDLTTGTLAATFESISSANAPGRGVLLDSVAGTFTVTGGTTVTGSGAFAIRVVNSSATGNFGATSLTGVNSGFDLSSSPSSSLTLSSLAISTVNGPGLVAVNGGVFNLGGTGNTIAATGGAAVDITSTSLGSGATFATLSSTNSSGKGTNLDTVTGTFTANGGSILNASGVCFDVNGGSSNISYNGNITCTANAFLVEITARTGGTVTLSGNLWGSVSSNGINVTGNTGGTINFSGGVKTMDTGADAAVTLANNSGATINFTGGGLDIDTTSGTGFDASGGATAITVTGTSNSILANGSGTALKVVNTSIGSAGLNFFRISAGTGAGSAGNGIHLDGTGLAAGNGGLTVTGISFPASGGTIQHKTGNDGLTTAGIGIYLNNTKNPSFSWMQLNDFDNTAILGRSVQGFTLQNSVINGVNGTTNVGVDGAIAFGTSNPGGTNGLQGTGLIRNTKISGGVEHNLEFYNQSGSMTLTIDGTTAINENNPLLQGDDVADCIIEENSVALGGDGIQVEMQGTATATVVVDRCLFRDNKSQAVQVAANDSSALTVTVDESFTRKFDQGNEGFLASNGSNGDLTLMYSNNQCNNTGGTCFFVGQTPGNATSASFLNATIANNVVNMPTTATNSGILVLLTSTVGQISTARLRIDGNVVTNNSITGVARGILVDTPDASTSPKFDVTVTNNTVSVGDNTAGVAGIAVQGRQSSDACASIGSNTVTFPNGTPGGVFGLRAREVAPATFDLEETGPCFGAASTVLACRNPASTTEVLGTLTSSAAGSCLLPSVP